ncbi:interferon gamma precursor [Pelodiscus sinensis]|uniref:Interferon gamma n=1 Tax=Pelodiscus sinensis TaxID=13735 RepID=K7GF20_PELSI|nr:interferon gamma precursor [Pelodiscus sinensis]AFK09741.1 IFN-gamma [Pelodiscus sinensis]AFK09742.1 IFN-gamma [Pelodiscus sinensis]|eukprot:NP_001273831.1 interferon gamma precursor [Pelodiscus sinensis]
MTPQTYFFILLSISSYFGCVFGQSLLTQIEDDIEKLKADFNSNQSDVADGGSIFTERLKSWTEITEKKIILSQIVSLYLKMFSVVPTNGKHHIVNINNALHTLNNNLTDSFKKVKDLMELSQLQMNDSKIQRKAVNELFPTLQKLLQDHPATHNKRKRSQSQKRKCRC